MRCTENPGLLRAGQRSGLSNGLLRAQSKAAAEYSVTRGIRELRGI